jgi:hypothetical protein
MPLSNGASRSHLSTEISMATDGSGSAASAASPTTASSCLELPLLQPSSAISLGTNCEQIGGAISASDGSDGSDVKSATSASDSGGELSDLIDSNRDDHLSATVVTTGTEPCEDCSTVCTRTTASPEAASSLNLNTERASNSLSPSPLRHQQFRSVTAGPEPVLGHPSASCIAGGEEVGPDQSCGSILSQPFNYSISRGQFRRVA